MAKRERQANSGAKLRAIRQQLGWSMREVHTASVALAKKHRQPAFEIAPSRLHDIERNNQITSIHRLYSLALIYRRTVNEFLSLYGIPLTTKI
jgi:transcriptional regulator with XRE-family HTH domain